MEDLQGVDGWDLYQDVKRIGEGAFGEVRLAIDRKLGRKVALKKIRFQSLNGIPKAVFREIESLKILTHRNIIKLYRYFPYESSLIVVMEYAESDLGAILQAMKSGVSIAVFKSYCKMILSAIGYCHSLNIIHRDLKPSNILICNSGELKIGDFGLARILTDEPNLSFQVATRWYRAPELLYASRCYDEKVDIWALGAIFIEMLLGYPFFPGNSDLDQMTRVFRVTGTPTEENWPGVSLLPDYDKICFNIMSKTNLQVLCPHLDPQALCFVEDFIQLDPKRRCCATNALCSKFFKFRPWECPIQHLPKPSDIMVKSPCHHELKIEL